MKLKTLLSILMILSCYFSFSQNSFWCGTYPTITYDSGARKVKPVSRVFGPYSSWSDLKRPCKSAKLRVKFHRIIDPVMPSGFADPSIVTDIMQQLNAGFNSLNISFELVPGLDIVSNAQLFSLRSDMIQGDNNNDGKFDNPFPSTSTAIDIYLLGNGLWTGVKAMAATSGASAIIFSGSTTDTRVYSDPVKNRRTICHEMGHCLGLQHTFFQTACNVSNNRPFGDGYVEYSNGLTGPSYVGNGVYAGDFVEDTWPDPTAGEFWPTDGNCREIMGLKSNATCDGLSEKDPGGYDWKPLTNNFMDYDMVLDPSCPSLTFTAGQIDRMLHTIASDVNVNNTVIKSPGNTLSISIAGSLSQCATNFQQVTFNVNNPDQLYYYDWVSSNGDKYDDRTILDIATTPPSTTKYTVTAVSECMLPQTAEVTLVIDDNVNFKIDGPDAVCEQSNNNQYTVRNIGTASFSGNWSSNMSTNASSPFYAIYNAGLAGNTPVAISYTSSPTSPHNCIRTTTKNVDVVPLTGAVINVSIQSEACEGDNIDISVSGTPGLSNFTMDGKPITPGSVFSVNVTSTHQFVFTATTPCSSQPISTSRTVIVHPLPTAILSPVTAPVCFGSLTQLYCAPTPGYATVDWIVKFQSDNTQSTNYVDPANSQFVANQSGEFNVYAYLTDPQTGCINNKTSTPITVLPTVAQIIDPNNLEICAGTSYPLTPNFPGGTWSIVSPQNNIAMIDPATGVITGQSAGTVTVKYEVGLDCNSGAISTAYLTVKVLTKVQITQYKNLLCRESGVYQFEANVPGIWYSYIIDALGNTIPIDINQGTINTNTVSLAQTPATGYIVFRPAIVDRCNASDGIKIPVTIVNCTSPCNTPPIGKVISGLLQDVDLADGLYYINGEVKISGTVKFRNAQILIADGVGISINDDASLSISKSHLYSCGMWNGIQAFGKRAVVSVKDNSLIEDAQTAISYYQSEDILDAVPNYYYPVIQLESSIFNRNYVDLQIENLKTDKFTKKLPVLISNCIFTSRHIPFAANTVAWDEVNAMKLPKSMTVLPGVTPLAYSSPYIDGTYYTDYTSDAFLHSPIGLKPSTAIDIKNVGTRDANMAFQKLIIGTAPVSLTSGYVSNTNIFDNHNKGIRAEKTNLVVNNCVFQTPKPIGNNPDDDAKGIEVLNNRDNCLEITTPSGYPRNAFFDMNSAMDISGNDYLAIENCDIRSNQDRNALTRTGEYGMRIQNSYYHAINVTNNNIHNVQTGIYAFNGTDFGANLFGNLNVTNNNVGRELPGLPNYNAYLKNGIHIAAFLYGDGNQVPVTCVNNRVASAVNGIKLSGWNGSIINGNVVTISEDIPDNAGLEQFGICLEGGRADRNDVNPNRMEDNTVTGYGWIGNTTGILLVQQSSANIGCNQVGEDPLGNPGGLLHGFRFVGNNPVTKFWDNTMYATNKYGMTLWEDGTIDKQGNEGGTHNVDRNVCTSNNSWDDAFGWNASLGQYMTNCVTSDASKSPLVIRENINHLELNPKNSYTTNVPNIMGFKYAVNDGTLIIITNPPDGDCERCSNPVSIARVKSLLQEIADGTVSLPADDADERLLVMQQQLYELLKANPKLVQNDTTLQQFIYNNQWSSLDFIYYAGRYVAEGRWDLVQMLLGAWPGQSNLDNAYRRYFEWLKNMHDVPDWRPNMDEVWELANRCPAKYGTVVFALRNLYNALTESINEFNDNCQSGLAGRSASRQQGFIRLKQKPLKKLPEAITKNALLQVYPNPAHHVVNVQLPNMREVMIIDALGRVVLGTTCFGKEMVQLNTSKLSAGIYAAKVETNDGKIQTTKLIIK